ncbi:MAG: FAD-dependent monooxygenase [Alcaligenaceae bacterium]
MQPQDFDLAILGGGPVGSALALLLARLAPHPARIVLLQAETASQYGHRPELDPRVLAINHGSRVLLESLGAWTQQAALIRTIHVSQRGRLGRTVIRHNDFDVSELGCVVRYGQLYDKLAQAVHASGVQVLKGDSARVTGQDSSGVSLEQGAQHLRAKLVIHADGLTGVDATHQYTQYALLTRARASRPRAGWAFERFTNEGPLAVLPHPEALGEQSIVWCCSPERATALQALSPENFSHALSEMFGSRLGTLTVKGPVACVPLAMTLRSQTINGRCVAIGNAAQTLHPVAGQGLNLGLRDAATLAIVLRDWLVTPDEPPAIALLRYEQLRGPDRQVTVRLTDLLSRVFTTKLPLVEHVAGLALLSMDLLPALRAPLARHLLQGLRL